MKYYATIYTLMLIVLTCFIVPQYAQASAVPAQKYNRYQHKKTKLSKKRKRLKRAPRPRPMSIIWWLLIGWYALSFALLAIGLALAIPALWITAVVLLLLPIAAAIVLGIVFLITLFTSSWEC